MRWKKPLIAALVAVAAAVLWARPGEATVMVEIPLDELVRDADVIVHATVARTGTQMVMREEGAMEPHTLTEIHVQRWLKGSGPDRLTIRELGGDWQQGGMRIDGVPRYARGEEVIVFLERHPEHPDHYRTFQMVQGKFVVMHGTPGVPSTVKRDLDGVGFARWAESGEMSVGPFNGPAVMQLDGFVDLIVGGSR